MQDEVARAIEEWRRATGEVAAAVVETAARGLAEALRGHGPPELAVPMAELEEEEEGDEHSAELRELAIRTGRIPPRDGILEQSGWTEEEYESSVGR